MNVIQIGCNLCDDEVFNFVKNNEFEISNLLIIDALPKCIEIAKEKYSFIKEKTQFINCAIGTESKIIDFFYPKNEETSAHASIFEKHVKRHFHKDVEKFSIECFEINEFLEKHFYQNIDLFAIDIEGMDVDVLLKLDLNKFDVSNIIYEFTHSDDTFSIGRKHQLLIEKLNSLEYSHQQITEHNILATKNAE
jgi:FkbM family methyltransferase